jgi:hypothetical protein
MLVAANLLMALAVVLLGSRFGAVGAASAFAAVVAMVIMPGSLAIGYHCRQKWHGEETAPALAENGILGLAPSQPERRKPQVQLAS